ncbi:MAG: PPOX class F420-dependent oxidoreductase [Rhodococcus sp. (in: high G+C Gram-positive bacteria)]|uniref:PPOX class F420-dependent oxidoreductase n=1 Tax=Rhodococcus sp. TaxID=1831 RepID=UPI003BB77C46
MPDGELTRPSFADLAAANYVLLSTFRKNGTTVPTAVWAAADGDRLLVWTATNSHKITRLRRDPRITLAVCDARGKPRSAAVDGTAVVLDDAGTDHTRTVIARKYGILGWLLVKSSLLRRGRAGTIGLACSVDEP